MCGSLQTSDTRLRRYKAEISHSGKTNLGPHGVFTGQQTKEVQYHSFEGFLYVSIGGARPTHPRYIPYHILGAHRSLVNVMVNPEKTLRLLGASVSHEFVSVQPSDTRIDIRSNPITRGSLRRRPHRPIPLLVGNGALTARVAFPVCRIPKRSSFQLTANGCRCIYSCCGLVSVVGCLTEDVGPSENDQEVRPEGTK